jgi:hypothetical protein
MRDRGRRLGALLVALLLAGGASFLATGAAADVTGSYVVGVDPCDGATQLCTPVPTVALPTAGVLRAEFQASTLHCSTIVAHLLVDGLEKFTSGALVPGAGTGVQDFGVVPAGVHTVGVQAEGLPGGCNGGALVSWSGTLSLTISGATAADAAIAAPGETVNVSTVVGVPPPRPPSRPPTRVPSTPSGSPRSRLPPTSRRIRSSRQTRSFPQTR